MAGLDKHNQIFKIIENWFGVRLSKIQKGMK
jgi:hypothetical protein